MLFFKYFQNVTIFFPYFPFTLFFLEQYFQKYNGTFESGRKWGRRVCVFFYYKFIKYQTFPNSSMHQNRRTIYMAAGDPEITTLGSI